MNKRPEEIARQFNAILDAHLAKIVSGEEDDYPEIHSIAERMNIHPTHLSNTLKKVTGKAPCDICNEKTVAIARELMSNPQVSIASVAHQLTFEPTNFTKYFKRHTGETPSQFRNKLFGQP